MRRYDIINEIARNVSVMWRYYGTWEISATVELPTKNGDIISLTLSKTSHNEEDKIGIFDGEQYNPLCGCCCMDELDQIAKEECMTTQEFQKKVWADSGNEDNYEPDSDRKMRLAETLYEYVLEEMDEFGDLEIED